MKLRQSILLCSLLLATVAGAQDLTKKIDYTTKAVTFGHAFTDIGKQAGVGLFAEPDLENEIIVLRLKDVTLQDAMQRIADTVGAQWNKTADGYELDRSPETADKLRAASIETLAESFKSSLDQQMKQMQIDQPLDQTKIDHLVAQMQQSQADIQKQDGGEMDYMAYSRLQNTMPDQRAMWRVLSLIDPKEIASIEDGQRVVFSNKPTQMQRDISADLSDIGPTLMHDHNLFITSYEKIQKPAKEGEPALNYPISTTPIKTEPVRYVVSVQKPFFSDSVTMQMIAFDADNHAVNTSNASMEMSTQYDDVMVQRARLAKQVQTEAEIPITPLTQQMLSFMKQAQSGTGGDTMQQATGDLRQALLHPDDTDPLAYALSEAFLGIADRRNENLVLYPDDSMFLIALFAGMEGSFKPSLVMQAVSGLGQMMPTLITEQDGWLTLAPVDRLGALKSRTDRSALGNYLRAYDQQGFLPIDTVAKFAQTVKGYQFPMLAMFVPMMLAPEIGFGAADSDVNILKLYASFGQEQVQRLEANQSLKMAELSQDQVELLSRYVFNGNQYSSIMTEGGPGDNSSPAEQAAKQEMTEVYPDGLTSDMALSMKSTTANTYFVKINYNGSLTMTQPMDINTLAYFTAPKSSSDSMTPPGYTPKVLSIQPGQERTMNFTLSLGNKQVATATLKEQRKGTEGPWTLDKLPADLKAQLDKAAKNVQNNPPEPDDSDAPTPVPVQVAPPSSKASN